MSKEYKEGYHAYSNRSEELLKTNMTGNPYKYGTEECDRWNDGFYKAKTDSNSNEGEK